jgi:hypothetical protein
VYYACIYNDVLHTMRSRHVAFELPLLWRKEGASVNDRNELAEVSCVYYACIYNDVLHTMRSRHVALELPLLWREGAKGGTDREALPEVRFSYSYLRNDTAVCFVLWDCIYVDIRPTFTSSHPFTNAS